jgi:hypothetical protein
MKSLEKLASIGLVAGALLSGFAPAFAATSVTPATDFHFTQANVILNSKAVVKASRFVSKGTSYFSLYDAEVLIRDMGDQVTWNGSKGVLNVTTPSGVSTKDLGGSGSALFEVNGKPVIKSNIIVTQPKGDKAPTTYVGIYWIQQILNQVNGASGVDKWDGAVNPATLTVTVAGSASANQGIPAIPWPKGTGQNIEASAPGFNWGKGN